MLEVELVHRLLADPAQQDAGVEGRERRRERRAQGVEQGEVGADRLVEPGAPQLHRDRGAVERAAVDLGQRGDRGRRVEVERVEHLAGRAAPRGPQRLLDLLGRERVARVRPRAGERRLERRERLGELPGHDDPGGAAEQEAAVGRLPQQRPAHVEERAQGGRDVGTHPRRDSGSARMGDDPAMSRPLLWPGQSVFRPWRLLPRYRRLVEHGTRADAVVLANDVVGANHWIRRLRLRVHFGDGTTAEITRIEGHRCASSMTVGERVPVRHDPADPRRVEVDVATFDRRFRRWLAQSQERAVRRTEARIEAERADGP